MSDRIIKTGLSKKYKDMLDSVLGQMSDGYWENTPMMRGYWKFVTTGTSGNEVTLNVDETFGALYGNRFIENRFYRMSDDAVKKFFADKIKFLIKEEGLGKWARDNEATTDYLSYGDPYRVKDCYYAYEILKGRNARKHPEYGDVAEANMKINEGHLGELLEEVAQVTGALTYSDAWRLDAAADDDKEFRKKVRDLLHDFEDAAYDGDEAEMGNVAKKLKELADGEAPLMVVPLGESRMHLGRCKNCGSGWTKTNYLDELEPVVRKYFKAKGYADNADICPKCVAAAKKYLAQGKAEGATYDEYVDAVAASLEDDFEYSPITALEFARDDFKDITKSFYSATKDPKEAAKEIDAKYMGESRKKADANESFEGWDDWEDIEGLENTLNDIEGLTYELRSCVRGAKTGCKDWEELSRHIQSLADGLEDAAALMAYKREDESKKKNPREDGRKKSH